MQCTGNNKVECRGWDKKRRKIRIGIKPGRFPAIFKERDYIINISFFFCLFLFCGYACFFSSFCCPEVRVDGPWRKRRREGGGNEAGGKIITRRSIKGENLRKMCWVCSYALISVGRMTEIHYKEHIIAKMATIAINDFDEDYLLKYKIKEYVTKQNTVWQNLLTPKNITRFRTHKWKFAFIYAAGECMNENEREMYKFLKVLPKLMLCSGNFSKRCVLCVGYFDEITLFT